MLNIRQRKDEGDQALLLEDEFVGNTINSPPTGNKAIGRGKGFLRGWIAFFLMGLVNNLPYVVVSSASKTLADHYCDENLIGAITWANVGLGFLAKGSNVMLFLDTPYNARLTGMVVVMVTGLLIVAFATSFTMAIVGVVIAGAACSFGEGVALGYLKEYNSMLVNAWSSGTGMAGVGGSALYLAYIAMGMDIKWSFLATIPWLGVYILAFVVVLPKKKEVEVDISVGGGDDSTKPVVTEAVPKEKFWNKFKHCFKHCRWVTLNLCLVYVFEYVISAGLAAKCLAPSVACTFKKENVCNLHQPHCHWHNISDSDQLSCANAPTGTCSADNFMEIHAYAIFAFCYQFGVLISRSSLQIIQIDRVEILTLLQCANFVLWLLQTYYKVVSSAWPLFLSMFTVGLLGGASYVNVFHVLLKDPKIDERHREFTINLAALFGPTLGITVAALLILLLDNTLLRNS